MAGVINTIRYLSITALYVYYQFKQQQFRLNYQTITKEQFQCGIVPLLFI